jgi:hypothetical protein
VSGAWRTANYLFLTFRPNTLYCVTRRSINVPMGQTSVKQTVDKRYDFMPLAAIQNAPPSPTASVVGAMKGFGVSVPHLS